MKKKIMSVILCLAMMVCVIPANAFAVDEQNPYASGLNDTASYFMNVYDDTSKYVSSNAAYDANLVCHYANNGFARNPNTMAYGNGQAIFIREYDGETFMELDLNETVHATTDAQLRFYFNAFYGASYKNHLGVLDGIETTNLTHMAFRVKISGGTADQTSKFSIGWGVDKYDEINLSDAYLIDLDANTVIDPNWSGKGFTFTGEFNGWIVVPFTAWGSKAVNGVTYNMKDIILGTVPSAVDNQTGADDLQIRFHNTGCTHNMASSWEGKILNLGDIFVLEDTEQFNIARLGCSEAGHLYLDSTFTPPTLTSLGSITRTCAVCGNIDTQVSYLTGQNDSASYLMKVYGNTSQYVSSSAGYDVNQVCHYANNAFARNPNTMAYGNGQAIFIRNYNGETFMELDINDTVTADSQLRFYFNAFYGADRKNDLGVPDEIETENLTHMAFRIKITGGEKGQTSTFTIGWGADKYWETNLGDAYLVDLKGRKIIDPNWAGRGFTFTDEFDGWIVVPFTAWGNQTISGTTYAMKDIILGTIPGAVDNSTGSNDVQIWLHNTTCSHSRVSSWAGRVLNVGNILVLENTNAFNSAYIGCENYGHDYVSTVVPPKANLKGYTEHTCTVCGESYKDTYTDAIGEDEGNLSLGIYHVPQFAINYLTDGVNTKADKLEEFEDFLAEGYCNSVFLPLNNDLADYIALCKEYNCEFWLAPGPFRSNQQTIEAYIANTEVYVDVVKEQNAWDCFLGFHWDEPLWNGMSDDEYLAMTRALYEKWGKRNFPVFAIASFLEDYYSSPSQRTTDLITTESLAYTTDAGWDVYTYDVRDSALTNGTQNNAINNFNNKYGTSCANAKELYRWIHSQMLDLFNHDVNSWFFPAAFATNTNNGSVVDEGYAQAHLEFFSELLREQEYQGGLFVYSYATFSGRTGLEKRLPVTNLATGQQLLFPNEVKWNSYANDLNALKSEFDVSEVDFAELSFVGNLDVTHKDSTSISYFAQSGFEYSIDGGVTYETDGKFDNLTAETAYTIRVKRTVDGAYSDFTVATTPLLPYASGLNDTASYALKLPTSISIYGASYGHVGAGIARTLDDSAFVASGSGYLHLVTIDGERFIRIQTDNRDGNSVINAAFGDNGRAKTDKGISEGVDTTNLSAFAIRIKTTGGSADQVSVFDFFLNSLRTHESENDQLKFLDKATGNVIMLDYNFGINIVGNVDGWLIIDFDAYPDLDGDLETTNKEWIVNNFAGHQVWLHEDGCNHDVESTSWDNKTLYVGDTFYVEDVNSFISARALAA